MFLKEEILGSLPLFIWPNKVQLFNGFIVKKIYSVVKKICLTMICPYFFTLCFDFENEI